jgi:hypothetical protein
VPGVELLDAADEGGSYRVIGTTGAPAPKVKLPG